MWGIISTMDIQTYLRVILDFLNLRVVPFLLLLAFFFFLWNVMRYFIWHGDEEDGRASAKSLAIWGITAFAIIGTLWGIVNLIQFSFGIVNTQPPLQGDYINTRGTQGSSTNLPTSGGLDPNLP